MSERTAIVSFTGLAKEVANLFKNCELCLHTKDIRTMFLVGGVIMCDDCKEKNSK